MPGRLVKAAAGHNRVESSRQLTAGATKSSGKSRTESDQTRRAKLSEVEFSQVERQDKSRQVDCVAAAAAAAARQDQRQKAADDEQRVSAEEASGETTNAASAYLLYLIESSRVTFASAAAADV